MKKTKEPENDGLDETLTIRITSADKAELAELMKRHPLAKRGAVAREAFRRGMEALQAENGGRR